VENNPINYIDPSGLQLSVTCVIWTIIRTDYNPDGSIKAEYEIGPRWIVCTTTGAGNAHTVTFPGLGGTNSTPNNDPNKDKITEANKCLTEKLSKIEKDFHEKMGDLDTDLQQDVVENGGVAGLGGAGVGYLVGGATAGAAAAGAGALGAVGVAVAVGFDIRRRETQRKRTQQETDAAWRECIGGAGLKGQWRPGIRG